MLINAQSLVVDHMDSFYERWCVYEHIIFNDETQQDETIYIGHCVLRDLFIFSDARNNSKWQEIVSPKTVLTIKLLNIGDRADCANERSRLAMYHRPICNVQGMDTIGLSMRVTCNETGDSWANQQECALALGINQGQLSNHLSGRRGYKTIRGKTFRKGL